MRANIKTGSKKNKNKQTINKNKTVDVFNVYGGMVGWEGLDKVNYDRGLLTVLEIHENQATKEKVSFHERKSPRLRKQTKKKQDEKKYPKPNAPPLHSPSPLKDSKRNDLLPHEVIPKFL